LHPASPTGYAKKSFSIGSWNARSLFHFDRTKLKRKIKILTKHIRGMDVFCVQESRGSCADILKHCRLLARDFWIKASCGERYGGVITFVSKISVPDEAPISDIVIVPGRAIKVVISGNDCGLVIYNVHNFDLQGGPMASLCRAVDADITLSQNLPLLYNVFCCGRP